MTVNKYIKVEDDSSLVRDASTNAILNTDRDALLKHRNRKAIIQKKDNKINDLENRIESLEILLQKILNNSNG